MIALWPYTCGRQLLMTTQKVIRLQIGVAQFDLPEDAYLKGFPTAGTSNKSPRVRFSDNLRRI